MSIQDKITRLQTAKEDISEAITAAGGTVAEGDGFEEFSSDIGTISSGITVEEDYTISEGKLSAASIELDGDVVAHIPSDVVTIGNKAFMSNALVNKVIMPDSVTAIEDGTYQYPGSPDNAMAFGNCLNLKEVVFSNNLTSIGNYAFYNCTGLTSITIPDSVTRIGNGAFDGCTSLTSITIPDSVTSIGNVAFNVCTSLTSITIPDSVTSIGDVAFNGCTSLTDIYYTGTQAEWEAITGISGAGIPAEVTIHYEYTPAE